MVYDFFDRERDAVEVPEGSFDEWRISVDYGTANPASFGLWGRKGGIWYRVKEAYYDSRKAGRQKTDAEYVEDLKKLAGDRVVERIIVDPSAASFIEALRRSGFRVKKANNDVADGIRVTADMLRQKCEGERVETIYAPPDLWNRRQDTGRSVAETFASAGMPLVKASNNRVAGWLDVREWLKVQGDAPMLRISRDCTQLIKGLEELQHDKRDPSDVAGEPHEITHAPDALRYFIAGRPMATQPKVIKDEFEPPEYEEQIYSVFGSGW